MLRRSACRRQFSESPIKSVRPEAKRAPPSKASAHDLWAARDKIPQGVTMWTSLTQSVFLPLRNVRDMAHFELLVQQRTGGLRVTAYAPQGQRLDTMEAVRAVRHVIVIATARFVGGHTSGRRGRALSVEAMSRTAEVARADHRGAARGPCRQEESCHTQCAAPETVRDPKPKVAERSAAASRHAPASVGRATHALAVFADGQYRASGG